MRSFSSRAVAFALVIGLIITNIACVSYAADAKAVLSFKVSDDGYAVVADCDEKAAGVVSVPTSATVNNKTYKVKYIGDKAFDKCKLLTEIYIPEGVTAIGSYAFRNCTKLKNVYVPESLIRCEFDAFNGCEELTVHCFMSTYQFISIAGIGANVTFNIIDLPEDDGESDIADDDSLEDLGLIGRFIKALRDLIQNIMDFFGANDDDDFSIEDLPFDLPFELPFEIPEENDSPFIDLL